MLEGNITRSVVLSDEKTGGTVLMGVAEYFGSKVNFRVAYDWDTLDKEWFAKELKETLARDLDIKVYAMDINERALFAKMAAYDEWNKAESSLAKNVEDGKTWIPK